ncbi:MAG: ParB/RepB/Spo0J family partition protein [Acidobacteria bacterium]|nr:ParB/RepB/Spo0J family partition protein [Acidobacteriota bacterium]
MARQSGLGRGLGALIPTTERLQESDSQLRELPIGQIEPNTYQPRAFFDEESLAGLAASIEAVGVLQPILVREVAPQKFELVAGERRWRAAQRAGLETIPAIVRPAEGVVSLEQALVENLHREDLSVLEEAAGYQQLVDEFGQSHDEIARRMGKSRSAIANTIRLLQLSDSIQRLIADGRISAGHGRALLGSADLAFRETLAKAVVAQNLTVREVEERVRRHEDPSSEVTTRTRTVRPAALLELEEQLSSLLDTRVQISTGAKRGRLTVEFANLEDLERIYRVIIEGREDLD